MMEAAQNSSGGAARRTARKSTAGLPHARANSAVQIQSPNSKMETSELTNSAPQSTKRLQRTPARYSDYVCDFEPEVYTSSKPGVVHDDFADSQRRKRGRPRKSDEATPSSLPRKRGRPRKYPIDDIRTGGDGAHTVQVFTHDDAAHPESEADADNVYDMLDDDEKDGYDYADMKQPVNKSRTSPSGRPAAIAWNQVMICSEEKAIALCRAADWVFHDQRTNASGTRILQYNCKFMKKARWSSCRAKLKLLVRNADRVEMWRLGSHLHMPLADTADPKLSDETGGEAKTDTEANAKATEAEAAFAFTDDSENADGAAQGNTSATASAKRRGRIDAQTQSFIDAYVKVKPFAKPSAVLAEIEQRGLPVPTLKQLYNRLSKQNRPGASTGRRSRESASSDVEIDELSAELRKYEREHTVSQGQFSTVKKSPVHIPESKTVVVVYPRSAPPVNSGASNPEVKAGPSNSVIAQSQPEPKSSETDQSQLDVSGRSTSAGAGRKSASGAGATRWSNLFESPAEAILKWATAHSRQLGSVLDRMRNDPSDQLDMGSDVKKKNSFESMKLDAGLNNLQLHTPVVVRSSSVEESAVTGVSWCMLISTVAMLKLASLHKHLLQIDTSACGVWQQRVRVAMLGTSDSTQQFRCVCLVVYELLPSGDEESEAAANAAAAAAGNIGQPASLTQTTLEFILRALKEAVELVDRSIRVQVSTGGDESTVGESGIPNDVGASYQPVSIVCNYDEAVIRAIRSVFGPEPDADGNGDGPRIAICAKQVERDLKARCPSAAWLTAPFVQKNLKVLAGALSEAQFLKGAELFYNDFADSHGLGSELHKFCVYLKRYWVDDPMRRTWFAGYLPPATAKRNDGLHDRIGLFREKYRLLFANDAGRFLSWLCRAAQDWSDSDWHAATAADSNRNAHVYALEDFLAARTWSNERFKFIHISVEASVGPSVGQNVDQQQEVWLIADGTCSKYRKFFDDPTHSAELLYALATDYADLTTWKEYRLRRTQLLLVTKRTDASYDCTCIDYLQTALCKHSLGMAIRNGELIVPEELNNASAEVQKPAPVPSRPVAPTPPGTVKRKPGRPRLTPLPTRNTVVQQSAQNGVDVNAAQLQGAGENDAAVTVESDLGLAGSTEPTLGAANLQSYYDDQGDAEVEMNDSQLAL